MDSETAKKLASLPEGAEVTVRGYTDSKGVKTDKRVILRGADFYPQLIQETVKWLQDKVKAEDVELAEMGEPNEARAFCQMKLATLQEKKAGETRISDQEVLSPCVSMKGGDTVYLKNIEYAERPAPAFKPGDVSGNVQKAWPLARYNVQLKLCTNFDSISSNNVSL